MTPLESGAVGNSQSSVSPGGELASLRPVKLVLREAGNVGDALRGAREALGLEVEDIAQATRVSAAHLAAIEAFDLGALPARPFAVGYVRAYARALGLDADAVVARFKAEAPPPDRDLRAPGGLSHDAPRRSRWLAVLAMGVVAAVVVWNLTRHARVAPPRPGAALASPHAALQAGTPAGPAILGAPLPPPPEASTPAAYETPGLAAAMSPGASSPAPMPATGGETRGASDQPDGANPPGAPFVAAGAIYGARDAGSRVILQARKPTSLIVRGPGGAVYFARQLAAGEAWRAPAMAGLIADAGAPSSIEVFAGGASRGTLTRAQTPLAQLSP